MWSDGDGGPAGGARAEAVILTALEVEYRAVRAHLEELRTVAAERGSLFEVGVFREGHHPGTSVAIHMTGPGNPGAAALVERASALFAPRTLLFVGVAGGRKDVGLGDVVAAEAVYDYETGKDTEDAFLPRQKTHQPTYDLVQLARMIAANDEWQRGIRPAVGGTAPRPKAHVKPIAAGGRVVAHQRSEVGRRLTAGAGDAVAVDMEGFGFLAGAYVNRQVDALVIRGISDLLADKDEAHDEHWQPVASRHAAAFAFELLRRLPALATKPAPAKPTTTTVTPRPTAPRKLRIRELGELADLLLAVPGLSSPASWQQLLDELPGVGTQVARQSASRAEALSLLRTCEAYGAWEALADVLEVIAPDAPATTELIARLSQLGLI
ncbi:phosphorylase family protein [Streptomyces milbemycinicus]|uniref:Nucleoside phosphorylase domain-containing protein n=1 Tax=Streptomyces milbemycinicus TaxID=476552 RepID=A0ABW8LMY0_9ACTN